MHIPATERSFFHNARPHKQEMTSRRVVQPEKPRGDRFVHEARNVKFTIITGLEIKPYLMSWHEAVKFKPFRAIKLLN